MIVLSRNQIRLVLKGSMTRTYRPLSRGYAVRVGQSVGVHPYEKELVDGRRTRPERCRIIVEDITTIRLGAVSVPDAFKAGFEGLEPLRELWVSRWRVDPSDGLPVQAIEFRRDLLERPRFLADVRAGQGDYSSSPARTIDPQCGEVLEDGLDGWARRAEEQAKLLWKLERRGGKRAA